MNPLSKQEKEALDKARHQYLEVTPTVGYINPETKKQRIALVIGVDYTFGPKGRGIYLVLRNGTKIHESEVIAAQAPLEAIKVEPGQIYTNAAYDPDKKAFTYLVKSAEGTFKAELKPEQFIRVVEYLDTVLAEYINAKKDGRL